MHLLTEIEEEAKFEQSDEEGDIKRNSDDDKEETVTEDEDYEGELLH